MKSSSPSHVMYSQLVKGKEVVVGKRFGAGRRNHILITLCNADDSVGRRTLRH
nr:hypothetical protein Q903MT_gene1816 [Picea sitchensis]